MHRCAVLAVAAAAQAGACAAAEPPLSGEEAALLRQLVDVCVQPMLQARSVGEAAAAAGWQEFAYQYEVGDNPGPWQVPHRGGSARLHFVQHELLDSCQLAITGAAAIGTGEALERGLLSELKLPQQPAENHRSELSTLRSYGKGSTELVIRWDHKANEPAAHVVVRRWKRDLDG